MSLTDDLESLGEYEVRKRLVNGGFGSPGSQNYASVQEWLRGKEIERSNIPANNNVVDRLQEKTISSYQDRWQIVEELGEGGQGKVFKVYRIADFDTLSLIPALQKALSGLTGAQRRDDVPGFFELFQQVVKNITKMEDPSTYRALKVLHQPKDARNPEKALDRIRNEIKAMKEITHPNLLPLLDVDPDSKWYVSPYYWKGTLSGSLNKFAGEPAAALRAFRPLVEAVAILHDHNLVHRDIKPANIFLDAEGNLILGDFGLVFFSGQERARLSDTFENVGSRDWMPGWAMSVRIEDVRPSFDVFSLGKVLWSMVSGQPVLPLWYFDKPKFNLEHLFRGRPYVHLINAILKKCVVEEESDCHHHARSLLQAIDKALAIIGTGSDIEPNRPHVCKICSVGICEELGDKREAMESLGLTPRGSNSCGILRCSHCGYLQLFFFPNGMPPEAWKKKQ